MRSWRLLGAGLVTAAVLSGCSPHSVIPLVEPDVEPAAPTVAAAPEDVRKQLFAEQNQRREIEARERWTWDLSTYPGAAPALRPNEPRIPPPGDVTPIWQPLDQEVRRIAENFPGRMSVVAVDLTSGARYEFRPRDRYLPASTFKLPVTLCTVRAIERGDLRWDTLVTFTPEDDDTVGQGGFATAPYGSKWSVRNLLDRSLISSNNVAVKMLARTLTLDGLARCTEQMGGMVTRTEEGSTPVTARDEAAWWLALWQMKQEQPELAENLLRPLRHVPYLGRIPQGTPRPDLVTHKFGTYPPYEHDGAIIWTDRPYLLVVMTYGGDHKGVDATIAAIARAAWEASRRG